MRSQPAAAAAAAAARPAPAAPAAAPAASDDYTWLPFLRVGEKRPLPGGADAPDGAPPKKHWKAG
jgi:hypothetical protein